MMAFMLALVLSLADATNQTVHLSLGTDARSMVVTWSNPLDPTTAAFVEYGDATMDLAAGGNATATSQTLSNNCNNKGPSANPQVWRNITVYQATLQSLSVGTQYAYKLSTSPETYNFTYLPAYDSHGPTNFAIFGDLAVKDQDGALDTLTRLREHHSAGGIDMILHVGDIAYDLREDSGRRAEEFLSDMSSMASSVPYMTCPGESTALSVYVLAVIVGPVSRPPIKQRPA
jgi:alkaline phosphatase D